MRVLTLICLLIMFSINIYIIMSGCGDEGCRTSQGASVWSDRSEYAMSDCNVVEDALGLLAVPSCIANKWYVVMVSDLGSLVDGLSYCVEATVVRNKFDILCHELRHLESCTREQIIDYNHSSKYFIEWVNPCRRVE